MKKMHNNNRDYIKRIFVTLAIIAIFALSQVQTFSHCCTAQSATKDTCLHCCSKLNPVATKISENNCNCQLSHSEPLENNKPASFIISQTKNNIQAIYTARDIFIHTLMFKYPGDNISAGFVYINKLFTSVQQFKALQTFLI